MSRPLLEVRRLTKRFNGLVAVDTISFTLHPGEIQGLVGPNGAGKTTLFQLITGYLQPTTGEVYYQSERITRWPPQERVRAGISRTFQKTRLFYGLSVEENVRLGCFLQQRGGLRRLLLGTPRRERAAIEGRIDQILALTGLKRYRTQLASQLSYGYQRRMEVAIALASDPKLLLLDEPFGGLSPRSAEEMGHLLETLRDEGLTVMLIEHRMESILSYCNRLFVMRGGRLLIPRPTEEGPYATRG